MSKRNQIIETTLELVANIGLYNISIPLIIKKSNSSAGTIYHHFKDKNDLIDTIYRELKKEMSEALIQDIYSTIPFKEKYILIWKNLQTFFIQNSQKFEFIEQYSKSPLGKREIKKVSQSFYQPAIDFFQSGIDMGILRNIPVNVIIALFFEHASSVTRLILDEDTSISEKLTNQLIQSFWDGIKVT